MVVESCGISYKVDNGGVFLTDPCGKDDYAIGFLVAWVEGVSAETANLGVPMT